MWEISETSSPSVIHFDILKRKSRLKSFNIDTLIRAATGAVMAMKDISFDKTIRLRTREQ
jgi:hypothetical protein